MSAFDYVDAATVLERLSLPFLSFEVDGGISPDDGLFIRPGQPIPIRWSVTDARGRALMGYTAIIYYDMFLAPMRRPHHGAAFSRLQMCQV